MIVHRKEEKSTLHSLQHKCGHYVKRVWPVSRPCLQEPNRSDRWLNLALFAYEQTVHVGYPMEHGESFLRQDTCLKHFHSGLLHANNQPHHRRRIRPWSLQLHFSNRCFSYRHPVSVSRLRDRKSIAPCASGRLLDPLRAPSFQ